VGVCRSCLVDGRGKRYRASEDRALTDQAPGFDAVQAVQEVADLILDSLLADGAQELWAHCSEFCDSMYDSEFLSGQGVPAKS